MSSKAVETVKKEVRDVRNTTQEAVQSGAYMYPIKGIFYFLSHRTLWQPLVDRLLPTLALGISVTSFMFVFTYLPQLAIQFFTSGPLAVVTTVVLVLSESSALTKVLAQNFLIYDSLIDTFDGTLVARGETQLVAKERQVKSGGAGEAISRLGKLVSKPFTRFTPTAIVRYFMYLPLNFLPVIGPAVFIALQGRRQGPTSHSRYFQLKGMSSMQKEQHVEERRGAYTSFGIAATLLEMVPFAGIFFAFTNTCGAALWAADNEQRAGTSTELREQAKKAR